jgi:transcriptional regulator with XRE-family HTH domain
MNKDKLLKKLGKKIAEVRGKYGYSQDNLAAISGVSRSQIHRIETGLCDPRTETIARFAKAIGADLKEFYDFEF